jgi:tripartite-type tricarboxylate transporter receptor subunit TctC
MRHIFRCAAAVLALGISVAAAAAQQYPSRAVTILVPYPAGGPTDQLARVMGPALSEKLGHPFIIENVSAGGTTIATARVARAAPDGYTLLLHNLQISANVSLYHNLPFDTEKDLTPIIFVNNNPLVLSGRKTLRPDTLKDLIAMMRTSVLKMAHPGAGATGHLATCLLRRRRMSRSIRSPIAVPRRHCRTLRAAMSTSSLPPRSRWSSRSLPGR